MTSHIPGLYIKFGQVCSVRPELVPAAYREKFKTLQSDVPGRPLSEVAAVVENDLGPIDSLFSYFDEEPCGAASIGLFTTLFTTLHADFQQLSHST